MMPTNAAIYTPTPSINKTVIETHGYDHITLINKWKYWEKSALPGDNELRSIAVARLKDCIERNSTSIDLQNLHLTELPNDLPPFLQELHANNNCLISLLNHFPPSLRVLCLAGNRLQHLPNNLPPLLEELNIAHNELKSLPETLPPALKRLDVSHTKLAYLPNNLPTFLEILNASHTQLAHIPSNLSKTLICCEFHISSTPITNMAVHSTKDMLYIGKHALRKALSLPLN